MKSKETAAMQVDVWFGFTGLQNKVAEILPTNRRDDVLPKDAVTTRFIELSAYQHLRDENAELRATIKKQENLIRMGYGFVLKSDNVGFAKAEFKEYIESIDQLQSETQRGET